MNENSIINDEFNNENISNQKIIDNQTQASKEITNGSDTDKKIIELETQISTLRDQLQRKAAEFENYKRRTENEFQSLIKYAGENLITDLLPVLDDFERSLKHAKESPDFDSLMKGVEMIYSKFSKILEQRGLKVIQSLNQPFDVNFHEALLAMPKEGVESNIVIQEADKGYLLNDKVIRHSKVIVSTEINKN